MPGGKMKKMLIGLPPQASVFTRDSIRTRASEKALLESGSIAKRLRARIRKNEEGGSLVETALVLPILLSIMLGMFSLTMALYTYQQLGYATFAAAEQLGFSRGLYTDPCYQATQTLMTSLQGYTASKLSITMTISNSAGTATVYGPFTGAVANGSGCTAAGTGGAATSQMGQNQPATVNVNYSYTWIPMWLLNLSGSLVTQQTALIN
jgi:Flp pilus assembly protein TadG